MKTTIALLLVLCTAVAHAELLVPKGAKGQLKVEYVFLTAQYTADPPLAVGTLHMGGTALTR
jgi:hypothetical protein